MDDMEALARELTARYRGASTLDTLRGVIEDELPGQISLVSSFGAESAALLHLVSRIDPGLDVVFLDTGRLFAATLRYRDALVTRLGLTGVRTVTPRPELIADLDPREELYATGPQLCCYIRKVEPLDRALEGRRGWITGRKRFQGATRASLPRFEAVDGRLKFNPLADWTKADIEAYFDRHALPRHPLEALGYPSIGCRPCTTRVAPGEDPRAGRWRGQDRVECGIHLPATSRAQPREEEALGLRGEP